jgi:predicted GTPase
LRLAKRDHDVVLWDGGNNDTPFFASGCEIVLCDPHRAGDESGYFPGETNLRRADIVVLSKVKSAHPERIRDVEARVRATNPRAAVVHGDLAISVDRPELLRGARAVVVEDGPTTTHGGMPYGAGALAARAHGATVVDPRPYAVGSLSETFSRFPHLTEIVPAMGYGDEQVRDLKATIERTPCDTVLVGTPIDLTRVLAVDKPMVRVRYELAEPAPGVLEGEVRGILR